MALTNIYTKIGMRNENPKPKPIYITIIFPIIVKEKSSKLNRGLCLSQGIPMTPSPTASGIAPLKPPLIF